MGIDFKMDQAIIGLLMNLIFTTFMGNTFLQNQMNIACMLMILFLVELFYLNSTLNFRILPVLVFQQEVCYRVDRLLTGLTAQQKGKTA